MSLETESFLFYQSKSPRPYLDYAKGIYMFDVQGKRYIDACSGAMVSNIGHSNVRVLEAMQTQMNKATFGYRLQFKTEPSERLAAMTAERMPPGLDRVFFVSGGSEAVESATKLARQYAFVSGQPERWKVISRFPSYHGCTLGALALTGYDSLTKPFLPMMKDMPKVPAPTCYLDQDDLTDEARGLKYADMLRDEILAQGPESVLAFIMEPVGGASTGALVAPDSYYQRIRDICDEFGVFLIYDEVMTGAGRTGKFLAAEHWNIRPDLIALSKGYAAGYAPLGAMVADRKIVDAVLAQGGFAHGFTYAGNPLACSAGVAVLSEIDRLGLVDNAATMGKLLKSRLLELQQKYPIIGDVRGKGLLMAIELIADREKMTPFPKQLNLFEELLELAYARGLIIYSRRTRGGVEGDHFLICPPLIVTPEQIEEIIAILDDSLDALISKLNLPRAQA